METRKAWVDVFGARSQAGTMLADFAGRAMQSLIAPRSEGVARAINEVSTASGVSPQNITARLAFSYADAMVAEHRRREKEFAGSDCEEEEDRGEGG